MFENLWKALSKFFGRKEFVITLIVILLALALLSYSGSKNHTIRDNLASGFELSPAQYNESAAPLATAVNSVTEAITPSSVVPSASASSLPGYDAKAINTPMDLLPADSNSEWAKLNPTMNASPSENLLPVDKFIGTQSQILRNANLQLRSDPPISRTNVGPWMNSTIEADPFRTPFEIGYGPN